MSSVPGFLTVDLVDSRIWTEDLVDSILTRGSVLKRRGWPPGSV